jgi:hypothetical protein
MKVDRQRWETHAAKPSLQPMPSSKPKFIESALAGRMKPEDQAYMARAILQLSDEVAELRRLIRGLTGG